MKKINPQKSRGQKSPDFQLSPIPWDKKPQIFKIPDPRNKNPQIFPGDINSKILKIPKKSHPKATSAKELTIQIKETLKFLKDSSFTYYCNLQIIQSMC